MNKILSILFIFTLAFSQELKVEGDLNVTGAVKFSDGAYDYNNYIVTFENHHNQEFESLAKWKVVGDSISTEGNWKTKMDELKLEGWEVSRAIPGEWNSTKNFTIIYELQKPIEKKINKPQKERKR